MLLFSSHHLINFSFQQAATELIRRINDIVDMFSGQFDSSSIFIPMIAVLREYLTKDEPGIFNTFLETLVGELRLKKFRQPLLDVIIASGLTLISSAENGDSTVSPAAGTILLTAYMYS